MKVKKDAVSKAVVEALGLTDEELLARAEQILDLAISRHLDLIRREQELKDWLEGVTSKQLDPLAAILALAFAQLTDDPLVRMGLLHTLELVLAEVHRLGYEAGFRELGVRLPESARTSA